MCWTLQTAQLSRDLVSANDRTPAQASRPGARVSSRLRGSGCCQMLRRVPCHGRWSATSDGVLCTTENSVTGPQSTLSQCYMGVGGGPLKGSFRQAQVCVGSAKPQLMAIRLAKTRGTRTVQPKPVLWRSPPFLTGRCRATAAL
jgi:hypothetical protein